VPTQLQLPRAACRISSSAREGEGENREKKEEKKKKKRRKKWEMIKNYNKSVTRNKK
jgi:hypothetical protein